MAKRKHSNIDKLPDPIKDTVEQMMQSNFTYAEIADYIKQQGFPASISSICRHAKTLNATVQSLRMAQENFRVIMEEVNRYPGLDTGEGIIRLLSHQVIDTINKMPEERWATINPEDLIRQATSLVRAASYKQRVDLQNKDVLDAGLEQVKVLVFESMSKERPDLYKEVAAFLASKGDSL